MTVAINPFVNAMHAYVPGEQPKEADVVKLNTNEAPYGPAPEVVDAVMEATKNNLFNKYPDPSCSELRQAIATRFGITADEVICGNGSDETLRMIVHAFTRPEQNDTIAVTNPTYTLYGTLAEMFGVEVVNYPAEAPQYSLPEELIEAPSKILFLPNPNPPIGTFYPAADLEILAAVDPDRLIVIDEAYVDFAPSDALSVYKKFNNVVISRTFSKSYSLAGLRIGFAIARPQLITALNKIRDSYNVNRLTQAAALAAWNARDYYADMVKRIKDDRAFLVKALNERGFTVPESHGNFVFARKVGAKNLYLELKERRVLVRYFDTPGLNDGLRITIGTREELEKLLQTLDEISAS